MLSKSRLLYFLPLSLRFLSMGLGRSLAFATPVAKLNDLNHVNNLVFRHITPCERIRIPESWALESGVQLKPKSGITALTIGIHHLSSTDRVPGIQHLADPKSTAGNSESKTSLDFQVGVAILTCRLRFALFLRRVKILETSFFLSIHVLQQNATNC